MKERYQGPERREFDRLTYVTPVAYKVCKKETITKLLDGYTSNISQAGLLCILKDKVNKDDILWLSFERNVLDICAAMDKRSLIYQNGIVGKVVRAAQRQDDTYDVGIRFLTREEKNLTNIYPQIHFLEMKLKHGQN